MPCRLKSTPGLLILPGHSRLLSMMGFTVGGQAVETRGGSAQQLFPDFQRQRAHGLSKRRETFLPYAVLARKRPAAAEHQSVGAENVECVPHMRAKQIGIPAR